MGAMDVGAVCDAAIETVEFARDDRAANTSARSAPGSGMTPILDAVSAASAPASWHVYAVSIGAMLLLAVLDFAMAICAKEWTIRRMPLLWVAGLLIALVLYICYARILRTVDLSVVTIGWVIFLQAGLIAMDRVRYQVEMPPRRWAAVIAVLALQVYLVLGGSGHRFPTTPDASGAPAAERMKQER